jgi:hypothetical protein
VAQIGRHERRTDEDRLSGVGGRLDLDDHRDLRIDGDGEPALAPLDQLDVDRAAAEGAGDDVEGDPVPLRRGRGHGRRRRWCRGCRRGLLLLHENTIV